MTFEELGIDISKIHTTGKTLCPKCSHDRKNKAEKCLSVDKDKGAYKCHNCGWSGGIYLKREFVKEYFRPAEPKKLELSEKTIKWFSMRGISAETLRVFKVSESKEWMPECMRDGGKHDAGQRNCINFNYYRNRAIVNIKYRDALKNFRMVKDAELIFYNLDAIKGNAECVITEGEIDAMSFQEAGIYNVVSVPNGASQNAKMEYLNNCFAYFENMKKIYVATDGDEPGQSIAKELVRRLGSEKCYTITYPDGCKDANEVLLKQGKEKVKGLLRDAKAVPIEGVMLIDKGSSVLEDIYLHGYPSAQGVGYYEFDEHIKWKAGDLTILTGIPGSGKSNFLDQLMIRLAMRHEWKFGIFSPENQPIELHIIKLAEIFTGLPYFRYDSMPTMNAAVKDVALDILSENFFFMKIEDIDISIDGILEKSREMVLRYGVNAIVIDPYNCIEHSIPRGYTETQYISELLEKIRRFKLKYNCHVFLVAHPTKMQKTQTGDYEVPGLYNISGGAHFYNKADVGITVYRNSDDTVDVHIQKIRHRWLGKKGTVKFIYHLPTGRYAEFGKSYSCEMDWLRDQATVAPPVNYYEVEKDTEVTPF